MRRIRVLAVLACLAVLSAACGARLNETEITAASGGGTGGGVQVGPSETGDGGSDGFSDPDVSVPEGEAPLPGTGPAGSPSGPSGPAGPAATVPGGAPAPTAPPGGNGGATDVGVSATEILLGNVSTTTGPVPGLFRGALVGAQAFAAYQNSKGGTFGRKWKIVPADDRLDSNANRAAHLDLAKKVFAFLGSFSVTEEGGAEVLRQTGVPDVGYGLSVGRRTLPNNFSPQPAQEGWGLGQLNYFKQKFGPEVITKMAGFYGDVPASESNYRNQKAAAESVGYKYQFDQPLQPTESNYTPYVIRMQTEGSKGLIMTFDVTGMSRMAKALKGQGLKLDLPMYGGNAYDPKFLTLAGDAANGAIFSLATAMYLGEDRAAVPEIDLFLTWMNKVSPGASADIFAVFSWAAGRLLAQALEAAGPNLTRAGLLGALGKIDNFDANGLLAPGGPASKRPPTCFIIVKVENVKFVRVHPPDKGMECNMGGYYLKR